ncbi:MAG: DNA alkylation repair protein [Elusimicrobia bacterium]|nr:MAG: DNA alkylation repair protein [Elusimicrobiota bacterium]
MAEPLKNSFGPEISRKIAKSISRVHPKFPSKTFLKDALNGYEALELIPRSRHIACALGTHLPSEYPKAIKILIDSIGPTLDLTENVGMAPFFYMPHVLYVSEYGIDHFDLSMQAQYDLTQRFTAEFSIRAYLMKYPKQTLDLLEKWAADPSLHVRRLVSEGTRPRLPWAVRLPAFQKDPRPVVKLLAMLKDDPELYVRRSVANNLNDIGKDNPDVLVDTVRRWQKGASAERLWLIKHPLRSAIKRGERGALEVMGFGKPVKAAIRDVEITTTKENVKIHFTIANTGTQRQEMLVDFRIHYVKANEKTSPKVFKLKTVSLAAKESLRMGKTISLKEMTTRKHYPGSHRVDVILNGKILPIGKFVIK